MKNQNYYSKENNDVFEYLTRFSRKNIYLIIENKIILEQEAFKFCRKMKDENKLKNFTTKDLKSITKKIYDYIIINKDTLLKKYGNRGKYSLKVKNCKSLKQKQKISAETSAFINSKKHEMLVKETIENLLKRTQKITIDLICKTANLSKPTVIKYYQDLKNDIKVHNYS